MFLRKSTKITLVQFFVNFLRPYADMPEFTTCVMKAMKELGHGVTEKSMYVEEAGSISEKRYSEPSTKSCRLKPSDITQQQDLWDGCDE